MRPIDPTDSEGISDDDSDSNAESDFECTQHTPVFKALDDHAPDWGFLETDTLMASSEDLAPEQSCVETDCFMSDQF